MRPWLSPWIGLFTGLVSGATGVFVFPAVPYLNSINLDKESLIQALGLTFTVSSAALAVVPTLAGMLIGQKLRHKLSPATFRKRFLISLVAIGVAMMARALFDALAYQGHTGH